MEQIKMEFTKIDLIQNQWGRLKVDESVPASNFHQSSWRLPLLSITWLGWMDYSLD